MALALSLYRTLGYLFIVTQHGYWLTEATPRDSLSIHGSRVCSSTHLCQPNRRCGRIPFEPDSCGCDSACEYYGDCCYDYWYACAHNKNNTTTVSVSSQLECMTGTSNITEEYGFYVISFCKDESTVDEETVVKCENTKNPTDDILLEIIVSDTKDNIYKNVYCALCNEVPMTEVTAWNITIWCDEKDVKKEFGAAEKEKLTVLPSNFSTTTQEQIPASPTYIHEHLRHSVYCDTSLSFKPPSGKADTRRPCTVAISECDVNYINISVIEACKVNYKAIVYDYTTGYVYLNPHCAICNNVPDVRCRPVVDLDSSLVGGVAHGLTPLTMMVDFTDDSRISVHTGYGSYENKGIRCAKNEVYDPFTRICLKLSCKDGFILEGSRCVAPSTSKDCDNSALHVTSEIFCECKLQEQSLRIDFEFLDYDEEMSTSVVGFKEDLKSRSIEYKDGSYKYSNVTVITILIETMKCEKVYDVSELLTFQINNKTDALLSIVTLRQNCSAKAIPNVIHCEYDSLLLTAGEELAYDNVSRTIRSNNSSTQIPDDEYVLELIHKLGNESSICSSVSFLKCEICPHIQLHSAGFRHQANGMIIHSATGNVFEGSEYLFSDSSNLTLLICSFLNQNGTALMKTQFFNYSGALLLVSIVCIIISLICLTITILFRLIIADLRTLSGNIILNISIALFFALLLTLIQGNFTTWTTLCKIVAATLHYLWLVCFFWMNAMAFELFQTFRLDTGSSRSSRSKSAQRKSFVGYFIYSWGLPAIYVSVIVTASELTSLDVMYGDDSVCWIRDELASFYVFGVPLAVILVPNIILFMATIVGIHRSMKSAAIVRGEKYDNTPQTGEMVIYIRISTVMGLTWIFGFLASFIDHILLWYLFTFFTSLQGFFIFVAFNLTHSMKNMLKEHRKKQTSTQLKSNETSLLPAKKNTALANILDESQPLSCSQL